MATGIPSLTAFFAPRTSNGLSAHRTAATDGGLGARPRSGRVQGERAELHGWFVSLGKHEKARRDRRAWHGGPRTIWRPRPAGVRYRAAARGDCQDLLRYRDGYPR